MDCFSRFTVPALALNSYFDLTINSADEGQLKTDNSGETFMKYVQGDIKASILIEDSPKTCAVFTALGGTAQQVTVDRSARSYLEELLTQTV